MGEKDIIPIQQFCTHYDIPVSFIDALCEYELIEIISTEEIRCINKFQIRDIEKMMRLHFDLEINMEGIDAIYNLLKQVDDLQAQVTMLSNKLKFHEHMRTE